MTHRVQVVDDEPDITALVAYHLAKEGYRVATASHGAEALKTAAEAAPDLVILDLMLPGASGYDVLQDLRRKPETRDVGVILLTARKDEVDRVRGLALGADDYVVKPFSPKELVLRVGAVLRRLGGPVASGSLFTAGPIVIDRAAHQVTVNNRPLELTATEYKLPLTLAERRGRVSRAPSRWRPCGRRTRASGTRTVDMHVQRLRSKLGVASDLVETVRGFGYRLRAGEPAKGRSR